MHLIRVASPCHLWTHTTPDVIPDKWFGIRHSRLVTNIRNASRAGSIPANWGGVRVFEIHPGGHGLHAHWVMRGYMDWHVVSDCAKRAGFGRVHVDPKPVTKKTAYYLANYLAPSADLFGVRRWANIGTYDGIGGRDLEITSNRIEAIKRWRAWFVANGDHGFVAYKKACQAVDDGLDKPVGEVPF